jgi:hypothetical protein
MMMPNAVIVDVSIRKRDDFSKLFKKGWWVLYEGRYTPGLLFSLFKIRQIYFSVGSSEV